MYSAQRKTNVYVHRVKNNQMHSIQLNGRKFVPRESGNHMYLAVRTTRGMDNQMHFSVRITI